MLVLALAGCGYQPPPQTDVAAPAYRRDLAACRKSAATAVDTQNAKRAVTWFASPVRRWGQIDRATSTCMQGKGYGRLRWCAPGEHGRVVVTLAGIQCADPPRPAT